MLESFVVELDPVITSFADYGKIGNGSVTSLLVTPAKELDEDQGKQSNMYISDVLDENFGNLNTPLYVEDLYIYDVLEPQQHDRTYQGRTIASAGFSYSFNSYSNNFVMVGGGGYSSEPYPEDPPTPDDLVCQDTNLLSPEELRDYKISEEAAKIAREILSAPNRDTHEYASVIYEDANGNITHTPIKEGGWNTSVPDMTGVRYGQVLGLVHSHTAATYSGSLPDFKLFPTPNVLMPNGQGDWWAFDKYSNYIRADLMASGTMSRFDVETRVASFRQYVVGPTGIMGTNSYQLRAYSRDDRDTNTLGQNISLNLGLCNG